MATINLLAGALNLAVGNLFLGACLMLTGLVILNTRDDSDE